MKKLITIFLMAGTIAMLFTSCLKDKTVTDYTNLQPIIIIPNANWPKNSATASTTIPYSTTPYTVQVYARVSWENTLTQDVLITFVKDEADIAAYNTKFGTSYLSVPDNAIVAASLKVTIPANTRDAFIPVQVKLDQLDATKSYILPYMIIDASGQNIAANYKTYLFPFSVKK